MKVVEGGLGGSDGTGSAAWPQRGRESRDQEAAERGQSGESLPEAALEPTRRSHSEQRMQDDSQVRRSDIRLHLLRDLSLATDEDSRETSGSLEVRKDPLGVLRTQSLEVSAPTAAGPSAIAVEGSLPPRNALDPIATFLSWGAPGFLGH